MPNRILLVFNPEPITVPGMVPWHDQKESMLQIARQVTRKAYWNRGCGSDQSTANSDTDQVKKSLWHDYLEDELELVVNSSRADILDVVAELPEKSEGHAAPCFAIIDLALYYYEADQSRLEQLKRLLRWLQKVECQPVYLVSTVRAPQHSEEFLKSIRPYYDASIQLLRSDSNVWDALYNLVKRGEHKVLLSEATTGADRCGDSRDARLLPTIFPQSIDTPADIELAPESIVSPQVFESRKLRVLRIQPKAFDVEQECKQPVIIRNCEIGRVEFTSVKFTQPVIFDNTQVTGEVKIRFCTFQSVLHFHTCRLGNDLHLELSKFEYRMPWFHKCELTRRLVFRRNITPDAYKMQAVPTLMFSRTKFEASSRIDMPEQRLRLIFYSCSMTSGEYTEVNWLRFKGDKTPPIRTAVDVEEIYGDLQSFRKSMMTFRDIAYIERDDKKKGLFRFLDLRKDGSDPAPTLDLDVYVRMVNCNIGGRIVFRENPHYTRFHKGIAERTTFGLMLSLEGSAIQGTVDVSEVRIRWLDVTRTNLQSGGIVMNRMQRRPILESFRLSSIVWDYLPVIVAVFVAIASLLPTLLAIAISGLFGILIIAWYCVDWVRRWMWLMERESEHSPKPREWWNRLAAGYGKLIDRYPRFRRRAAHIRRLLRVRAEYCGLVQHELIIGRDEFDHVGGRNTSEEDISELEKFIRDGEKWRFGDVARLSAQLEAPQSANATEKKSSKGDLLAAQSDERARRYYYQEVFSIIAQQYEDLSHAFANAPVTDELEDFCHYKALQFRNEATGMSVSRKFQKWVRIGALCYGIATALVFLMAFKQPSLPAPWQVIMLISWGLCTGLSVALILFRWGWDVTTPLKHLFLRLALERVLAYGVYPSRTFMSAFVLILMYSVVYTLAPGIPGAGRIDDGSGPTAFTAQMDGGLPERISGQFETISDGVDSDDDNERNGDTDASDEVGFPSMLYFSIVTFTTLGYGDMQPKGSLRIVAASEALIGAIMIAMITVSLARQFLRR